MKKIYWLFIALLLLIVGMVYCDYRKSTQRLSGIANSPITISNMLGSLENYYLEHREYPDRYESSSYPDSVKDLLQYYGKKGDNRYVKTIFTDPFSYMPFKLVKLKDKDKYIGVFVLSAGYGGDFVNKMNEIDIKDINKLKYYFYFNAITGYEEHSFVDYIKRDKDFIIAFYNRDIYIDRNVRVYDSIEKLHLEYIKETPGYTSCTLKVKVLELGEPALVSLDDIVFRCEGTERPIRPMCEIKPIAVGDSITVSGYLEVKDSLNILHNSYVWERGVNFGKGYTYNLRYMKNILGKISLPEGVDLDEEL